MAASWVCGSMTRRIPYEDELEAKLGSLEALKLPETDFKLRRAQQFPTWKD